MTDTRPQLPNWALNIVEKHGLHERTDEPLGGVIVLLFDAAEALKKASLMMTRGDAATAAAVEIAMSAIRMRRTHSTLRPSALAMRSRDCFRKTKTGASRDAPDAAD